MSTKNSAPIIRGQAREASLARDRYYSDGYFALPQLCSLSHQISEIHALRPADILEIGIGNGFTSSFLRRAGYSVTTADINPALEADICAPLSQVGDHVGGRIFDLVVCCEVLEHMPLEEFIPSLDALKGLGRRLFLTLPNYSASIGLCGFIRLPRLSRKAINMTFDVRRKKTLDQEHFWEVGSRTETSKRTIASELRLRYPSVQVRKFALNPYHIAFICG